MKCITRCEDATNNVKIKAMCQRESNFIGEELTVREFIRRAEYFFLLLDKNFLELILFWATFSCNSSMKAE